MALEVIPIDNLQGKTGFLPVRSEFRLLNQLYQHNWKKMNFLNLLISFQFMTLFPKRGQRDTELNINEVKRHGVCTNDYMHNYFYNSLEMLVNIEGKGNISLPFIHRGTFQD